METRKLGHTDLNLTTVGLGTWAIGGEWEFGWGPQDDEVSIAAVHRALELGVNWIDTAPMYGIGHSETVVGRALAQWSDEVIVATKCGRYVEEETGKPYGDLKAEAIKREVEESLQRLQVEVIDLYQIHWPDPDEDIEEAWGAIADLIGEGKVRYAGASNFSMAQLKRVQAIHPVASLQVPYSILDRAAEETLLDFCAEHDIGVVVYSPMQAGLLTGKFNDARMAQLDAGDWRRDDAFFQEPRFSAALKLVEKLKPVAARNGKMLAQLAISWTLRHPAVTSAIVGARNPSQIEETARAAHWALAPDEIDEIGDYIKVYEETVNTS